MLVGFVAGLLVFGFARVFGEPQVDRAIAFETEMDEAKADAARGIHDRPKPELFSRPLQANWGLLTGGMVYSTAFGGLFALANGRLAQLGARGTSAALGVCGFVSCFLVPNLKYPANPPSVGRPDTIDFRTETYAVMMAASLAAMVGAVLLYRHLVQRQDAVRHREEWSAVLWSAVFFLACVAVAAVILPDVNEVPAGFPATLLWNFRIDSITMQAILWTVLGLGFGCWVERTAVASVSPRYRGSLPRR